MDKLFDEGTVLKKAIEWMGEENDDLSLKATAALIVANIARNGLYALWQCIVLYRKWLPLFESGYWNLY